VNGPRRWARLGTALFGALAFTVAVAAGAESPDPHTVLGRHYEAVGGLENLKDERSVHLEATLSIAGLSGSIAHWEISHDRRRTEIDMKILTQTMGDNGTVRWEVDSNGKLRIEQDENELARRDVEIRLAKYGHLDPESDVFTLALEGLATVEGEECHVLKITNSLESTVRTWFIGTSNYLLRKSITARLDGEQHALFSDFRRVGELLIPFVEEEEILPIGQKQTLSITKYESNPAIDASLFEPPGEDVRDFAFTAGGHSEVIPFEFIGDHIFVKVIVDCVESRWILDSGASVSVIDPAFADELGLESGGSMKGQGAGHAVDVTFVTLPGMRVGGIEFAEQQIASIEFSELLRSVYELEVTGILGYDFLSRFVSRIDIGEETLTVYDPDHFTYEGDGEVVDAPLRGNIFAVPVTLDDRFEGRWTLDLGASGLSMSHSFGREHGFLDRKGIIGAGFGAGGRIEGRASRYDNIKVGGHEIGKPIISMPTSEVEGAFRSAEISGNLGNDLFRRFVLYLDYGHQQVIFEKGADFETEFPLQKGGLSAWRTDTGAYELYFVSPGTPADQAGLEEGDTLLSINGIDVEHLGGLLAIRDLMRKDVDTTYRITVRRDGVRSDHELTLRDLF